MHAITRFERSVIVVALAVIAVVAALGVTAASSSPTTLPDVSAPPDAVAPADSEPTAPILDAVSPVEREAPTVIEAAIGPLGFTDTQKRQSYQAASQAERGIQAFMDAMAALGDGKVAGEPLTASQLAAIVDLGIGGIGLAQARVADALAILGRSQTTVNNYIATHPVPDVVWCHETAGNCAD